MFLLAVQIFDRESIEAERLDLVHPAADRLERDLQQLGIEPRLCLLQPREQDLHLLAFRVDVVVPLILVVLERWVVPDTVRKLAELVGEAEGVEQPLRALVEPALQCRVLLDTPFDRPVTFFPGTPVRKDVVEVPLVLLGDLLPFT